MTTELCSHKTKQTKITIFTKKHKKLNRTFRMDCLIIIYNRYLHKDEFNYFKHLWFKYSSSGNLDSF